MDTSKEYILMCQEAEEIQKLREIPLRDRNGKCVNVGCWKTWEEGDFFTGIVFGSKPDIFCIARNDMYFTHHISCPNNIEHDIVPQVWLPLQWQLQKMIKFPNLNTEKPDIIQLMIFFTQFMGYHLHYKFDSLEKYWLAFVMAEKYSKQWLVDKQEWVKI